MGCYAFAGDLLLLKKCRHQDGTPYLRVPLGGEIPADLERGHTVHFVELPTGETVQTFALDTPIAEDDTWQMTGLRASYDLIPLSEYKAGGKAYQILYWDSHSRYCPVCGAATEQQTPIMKKCPDCGHEIYPRINTAIIVLIRRGEDEVLLVRARNFRGTFNGLVAGFLEPGETLEECVVREVMEETGLSVKNIRYFASQTWPYPSGLMCGFTADYAGGNIKLQDEELTTGAFFHRDHLPEIPRKLSIARKLIDAWLAHKV